jgi:hypothetical protein
LKDNALLWFFYWFWEPWKEADNLLSSLGGVGSAREIYLLPTISSVFCQTNQPDRRPPQQQHAAEGKIIKSAHSSELNGI